MVNLNVYREVQVYAKGPLMKVINSVDTREGTEMTLVMRLIIIYLIIYWITPN